MIEAIQRYYTTSHANVHRSIHTLGEEATERYEGARDAVRASSARAAARRSSSRAGPPSRSTSWPRRWGAPWPGRRDPDHRLEHHSNIIPWQMAARDRGTVRAGHPGAGRGLARSRGLRADIQRRAPRWWPSPTSPTCSARSTRWRSCAGGRAGSGAGDCRRRRSGCAAPAARHDRARRCDFYVFSATRCSARPASACCWARREVLERPRAHARRRRDDQGGLDRPRPVERPAVALRAGHARRSRKPSGSCRRSSIWRSSGWSGWPSTSGALAAATVEAAGRDSRA